MSFKLLLTQDIQVGRVKCVAMWIARIALDHRQVGRPPRTVLACVWNGKWRSISAYPPTRARVITWGIQDHDPLKRKCHFDEIFPAGCTVSSNFDNFKCSQRRTFHQNDIFVSGNMHMDIFAAWLAIGGGKSFDGRDYRPVYTKSWQYIYVKFFIRIRIYIS